MTRYIHQRKQWPAFRWDDRALTSLLADVRHRQGRLLGRLEGLGFTLKSEALLQTLTEEAVKSSEIEGEILNRDDVRSSIARRLGIDIGALSPPYLSASLIGTTHQSTDDQNSAALLSAERLERPLGGDAFKQVPNDGEARAECQAAKAGTEEGSIKAIGLGETFLLLSAHEICAWRAP